jgi:uncharacterized protein (DUF2336 family)
MIAMNDLIPELEAAIAHGSVERRVKALDHLTGLFLATSEAFSESQVAALDELFVRLSSAIEQTSRRALAIRLADHQRAPPGIIMSLADDDSIDVAQPVLARSLCLDDKALIKIVAAKNQEYLLAVSTRQSISPAVTDVLIRRGDRTVVRSVAGNSGAKFSEEGYKCMVDRAQGDDELSACVGLRADIPRYLFLEILKKASEAVRAKLEAAQPRLSQEIQQTVAEVVGVIRAKSTSGARDYNDAAAHIKSLQASRQFGAENVQSFAEAGRIEETTAALAAIGQLPIEVVERALSQKQTELIVVLARAIGLPWPATKAVILLCKSDGFSTAGIEQALKNFERLKPSTAQLAIRYYTLQNKKS